MTSLQVNRSVKCFSPLFYARNIAAADYDEAPVDRLHDGRAVKGLE